MTIQEAIDRADEMKANMMSDGLKIRQLTVIEQLIHDEIVLRHAHTQEQEARPVYTEDTDTNTELVVPDPYSEVYVNWLLAQIDRQNQEDERYNVDIALFEQSYRTMQDWWIRTHMPVQTVREFTI